MEKALPQFVADRTYVRGSFAVGLRPVRVAVEGRLPRPASSSSTTATAAARPTLQFFTGTAPTRRPPLQAERGRGAGRPRHDARRGEGRG